MRMRAYPCILLILVMSAAALSAPLPQLRHADEAQLRSAVLTNSTALVDTVYMLGDPINPYQNPVHNGTFQDAAGNPDWAGWTGLDRTAPDGHHWQISTFQALDGVSSMWCGTEFDGDPGYGNNWHEALVFSTIPAGSAPYTVVWQGEMRIDLEPNYDYLYVQVNRGGEWETLQEFDGERTWPLYETITVDEADLVEGAIELRFLVITDHVWSDEDGLWDTDGACQLDNLAVSIDGVMVSWEDFETPFGEDWVPTVFPGVGDFSALFSGLMDEDPCYSNHTPQVAFIDDGFVVPGTGGTQGITWRYGPGGYIVNNTGGLAGPDHYIHNVVVSPAMTWPSGCDGAELAYDYYVHEELGAYSVWPGMFAMWYVRSVDTGDPADLDAAPWSNQLFIMYGNPGYRRFSQDVSSLLESGRTHVQVAVGVRELGYNWGWVGEDGTPAPYFDNVQLKAFPYEGPVISGRSLLFNDGFPASGELDPEDLASHSVRLDCARNIADDDLVNQPGDSIWVDVDVVRTGAVLHGMPRMHVRMVANPIFDAVRVLPEGFTQIGEVVEGSVEGLYTYADADETMLIVDRYNFDLPDEGFFYPGDRLRYYFRAEDNLGGDIGVAIFPADTAGYASLEYRSGYPVEFEARALPTVLDDDYSYFDQPRILFWQDGTTGSGHDVWLDALEETNCILGRHVDVFVTQAPSSGVGNSLGGRANAAMLAGYDGLVYSSGSLNYRSLSGDNDSEVSDDVALLTEWFEFGGKRALFMGDGMLSGLLNQGGSAAAFSDRFLQADLVAYSIQPYISNQVVPRVEAVPGNGILVNADRWFANGGCPYINTFDGVITIGGAEWMAEFTDPNGNPGAYPYAAAWRSYEFDTDTDVVALPMDLRFVEATSDWETPYGDMTIRGSMLTDILCGWHLCPIIYDGVEDGGLPAGHTTARAYPNPFNPATTIDLSLARTGPVTVTVFNIRGERVRTLLDEHLEAGRHEILWDGTDQRGRASSSGVYFYEVKADGREIMEKIALIK